MCQILLVYLWDLFLRFLPIPLSAMAKAPPSPPAEEIIIPGATAQQIVQLLFQCLLPISGTMGYKKAEVTAGGIDLDEVDAKTMESKLRPGLFFAGEILDVDGRIGGFNFQWAWSSGTVAACALKRKLKSSS